MTESPLLYRFTVKCDRDTNREIERLAKACGVSASAYVQKHFETITGGQRIQVPAKPAPSVTQPKPARIKKQGPGERIMLALMGAKRADGTASIAQPALADAARTSKPTLVKYLDDLIRAGEIEIASNGHNGRPTVYRILKPTERDA
jgi:hypothetical protein